jgi:DNA-binding NtrC family response regulator
MKKGTVLIVDDDPHVLQAVGATLGDDYQVVSASSAAEGMEVLSSLQVNTVIADYKMPGKDGLTFLLEVRESYAGTSRILLTAFADMDLVVKALNEGAIHRFIAKPYKPFEMRSIVEECVGMSQLSEGPAGGTEGKGKVIVAHDSTNLLARLQIILRYSFDLLSTSNGLEVLDYVANHAVAGLVIGPRLEKMNGSTISAYLKQEKKVSFPIVLVSDDTGFPGKFLDEIGADLWLSINDPALDSKLRGFLEAQGP